MATDVRTPIEAERLAALLKRDDRDEPAIVIATYDLPKEIDPQELEDRTDAEVYVLHGYQVMQSFSDAMPPNTAVFTSRGTTRLRVYPADLDWTYDQALSRHLQAHEGRRYASHTLREILRLVEGARGMHAEDYDTGAAGQTTIAASIGEDIRAKLLAGIANTPADLEPQPVAHVVLSEAADDGPALQETTHHANELTILRTDLEAARRKVAALEVALREAREAKSRAIAEKADCRCQQIEEVSSAATAIRAAERQTRAAEEKVKDAESRADKRVEKANRLLRNRPVMKWIDQLGIAEEDLLRLLVHKTWEQDYGDDDKANFRLRPFEFQAPFVDTVNRLHYADRKKIITVLTDVVTGRAEHRFGSHPWRTAEGPEEPETEDPNLGILMRSYLEKNTSAAQRLHYWKKGNEPIRFHSVLRHDDKVIWPLQK